LTMPIACEKMYSIFLPLDAIGDNDYSTSAKRPKTSPDDGSAELRRSNSTTSNDDEATTAPQHAEDGSADASENVRTKDVDNNTIPRACPVAESDEESVSGTLKGELAQYRPYCRNQMGGSYTNGKPLPLVLRQRIIIMATRGFKASEISKEVKVSHGCISKIINRYNTTGSIMPGIIGGSKPKVATERVIKNIMELKAETPSIFAWEIRERLVEKQVCTEKSAPSVSSINRVIRNRLGLQNSPKQHKSSSPPQSTQPSFMSVDSYDGRRENFQSNGGAPGYNQHSYNPNKSLNDLAKARHPMHSPNTYASFATSSFDEGNSQTSMGSLFANSAPLGTSPASQMGDYPRSSNGMFCIGGNSPQASLQPSYNPMNSYYDCMNSSVAAAGPNTMHFQGRRPTSPRLEGSAGLQGQESLSNTSSNCSSFFSQFSGGQQQQHHPSMVYPRRVSPTGNAPGEMAAHFYPEEKFMEPRGPAHLYQSNSSGAADTMWLNCTSVRDNNSTPSGLDSSVEMMCRSAAGTNN